MDLVETVIGAKPYQYFLLTGKMAFLFAHWLIGQRVPFSTYLLQRHLKSVCAFVAY